MALIQVVAERAVGAAAAVTYRYLADYRAHHHRFLPPAFSAWRVERGGVGAGTVVRYRVTLAGRARDFRVTVAEPEPGRVLTECDLKTDTLTTFTVVPDGERSRVRFETAWPATGGIAGAVERLLAPRLLRRLYAAELDRLDRYAQQQRG